MVFLLELENNAVNGFNAKSTLPQNTWAFELRVMKFGSTSVDCSVNTTDFHEETCSFVQSTFRQAQNVPSCGTTSIENGYT